MTREETLMYQAKARAFVENLAKDDIQVDDIGPGERPDDMIVETDNGVWVKAWVYVQKEDM
jgi:hypothetical protein